MKSVLAILLVFLGILSGIKKIYYINTYSATAAEAYAEKKYAEAEKAYSFLVDSIQVDDDQLRLNLAHSLMQQQKTVQAKPHYQLLLQTPNKQLQSVAALQLGTIAARSEAYVPALELYKKALISDPGNEEARYNYELLKKYLEENPEKKQSPQQQQNEQEKKEEEQQKEKQNQEEQKQEEEKKAKPEPSEEGEQEKDSGEKESEEGESKEQKKQEPDANKGSGTDKEKLDDSGKEEETKSGKEPGKEKGVQEEDATEKDATKGRAGRENISEKDKQAQTQRERLKQMNISEDKANMILDAMRQAELQHLQQIPKKSGKPQKQDKNIPSW